MGSRGSNCEPALLFDRFWQHCANEFVRNGRYCGKTSRGSCTGITHLPITRSVCEALFGRLRHSGTRTRVLFTRLGTLRLLLVSGGKVCLIKGIRFESMCEEVKQKSAELPNGLTKTDFRHRLEQWKKRMKRCAKMGGVYIEGEHSVVE
ncbi:Hypothetical protein CINCED_3A018995 [Cinara cedri]|uniref:Uncharacterized protein n=1 Tax=Cinara cedri TaxID=506608 RepID=A0A5E4NQQ7_9HEMI|nr:Hypothetical protein CINCED_3A018995 [Cinara cedri]